MIQANTLSATRLFGPVAGGRSHRRLKRGGEGKRRVNMSPCPTPIFTPWAIDVGALRSIYYNSTHGTCFQTGGSRRYKCQWSQAFKPCALRAPNYPHSSSSSFVLPDSGMRRLSPVMYSITRGIGTVWHRHHGHLDPDRFPSALGGDQGWYVQ